MNYQMVLLFYHPGMVNYIGNSVADVVHYYRLLSGNNQLRLIFSFNIANTVFNLSSSSSIVFLSCSSE